MAKLYKTPNILDTLSRNSRRRDSSGKLLDTDKEISAEAPNALSRILKTLDRIVEEEMKKPDASKRKAITQSWLGREAQVSGTTYRRYEYLFRDTIEMLNKYYLCVLDRDKTETGNTIPGFETLGSEIEQKAHDFMYGPINEFAYLPMEIYGEFESKLYMAIDAWLVLSGETLRIHPEFAGYGLNELAGLIQKKYDNVQKMQEEYDRLTKPSF